MTDHEHWVRTHDALKGDRSIYEMEVITRAIEAFCMVDQVNVPNLKGCELLLRRWQLIREAHARLLQRRHLYGVGIQKRRRGQSSLGKVRCWGAQGSGPDCEGVKKGKGGDGISKKARRPRTTGRVGQVESWPCPVPCTEHWRILRCNFFW